jgi:hypothetical protein
MQGDEFPPNHILGNWSAEEGPGLLDLGPSPSSVVTLTRRVRSAKKLMKKTQAGCSRSYTEKGRRRAPHYGARLL